MPSNKIRIEATTVYPVGLVYCIKVWSDETDRWVLLTRAKSLDAAKKYAEGCGAIIEIKM